MSSFEQVVKMLGEAVKSGSVSEAEAGKMAQKVFEEEVANEVSKSYSSSPLRAELSPFEIAEIDRQKQLQNWQIQQEMEKRYQQAMTQAGVGTSAAQTVKPRPQAVTMKSLIEKYGSERAMWTIFWGGQMDRADRDLLAGPLFNIGGFVQHAVMPMMVELSAQMQKIQERLDRLDKRDE